MTNSRKVCGMLGLSTRAGKIVFGTEACINAINKKKIKLIILATDAAERTKINFKDLCKKNSIEWCEILTIEELSRAIGKGNKAIVGITDTNFSKEILRMINGGEVIG